MTLPLRIWRALERWIRAYLAKTRVSVGILFSLLQRLLGAHRSLSRSGRDVNKPSRPRARTFFAASSVPRLPTPPITDAQDAQSYLPDGAQTNSPTQLSPVLQPVTRVTTHPPAQYLDAPANIDHPPQIPVNESGPHGDPGHDAGICDIHWSSHDSLGLAMKSVCSANWTSSSTLFTQPPDKSIVRKITTTYASKISRYDRKPPPEDDENGVPDPNRYSIKPVTTTYDENGAECLAAARAGWKRIVHPEGALYWFHRRQRVFTDAPMADPLYRDAAAECIFQLKQKINANQYVIPEDAELVIELEPYKSRAYRLNARYYFVTHKTRRLFWLDEFDLTPLFEKLKGVTNKGHMGLAVEKQYWQHCEFFPYDRPVAQNVISELKEIVFHYMSEVITSDTSLTPFSEDELSKIRDVVEHAQEVEGKTFDHSICIIARLMRTLTHNRFFHFHGQTVARLDSDQPLFSAEDKKNDVSTFTRVFMLLLFNSPYPHLKRLRSVWIDKVVNQVPWKKFVDELNTEWKGYTLYSTVLLTVNLSLLALYNVMPQTSTNSGMHPQTVAEIMSYVSTTWSVGSVVTSLILVRQYETNSRQSIEEAVELLNIVSSSKHGIEMLAIIYSLPFGFLLWGLLFFSMAFLGLAFQDTLTATRVCVTLATFITLALVIWPIVVARDFLTGKFWTERKELLEDAWKEKDVDLLLRAFGLSLPGREGSSSKKQKSGKPSPSRATTRADTMMTEMTIPPPGRTTTHRGADAEELAQAGPASAAMALGITEDPAASALSMSVAFNAGAGPTPAAGSSTAAARGGASPNGAQPPADPPARQPSMLRRASTKLELEFADWQQKRKKKMSHRTGPKATGTRSRAQTQMQPQPRSQTMQPRGATSLSGNRSHEQTDVLRLGGPGAEERV